MGNVLTEEDLHSGNDSNSIKKYELKLLTMHLIVKEATRILCCTPTTTPGHSIAFIDNEKIELYESNVPVTWYIEYNNIRLGEIDNEMYIEIESEKHLFDKYYRMNSRWIDSVLHYWFNRLSDLLRIVTCKHE